MTVSDRHTAWPALPPNCQATCSTLHSWSQVVGKARLACAPWLNHSWHATFYVTTRGWTTSPIPYGARTFQIDFDVRDEHARVTTSDGGARSLRLAPQSTAAFHRAFVAALHDLDLRPVMHGAPNELPEAIPFAEDHAERPFDPATARVFFQVLGRVASLLGHFRSAYLGKVSPVHLFWGAFDLAVTRFSGRRAPAHPGGIPHLPDAITREAYSHEVSSAGFWPGGFGVDGAAFYSYAYPEPEAFKATNLAIDGAYYHPELREFILPYDVMRQHDDPDALLLDFLQRCYQAAADGAGWDRAELECPLGVPRVPRPV
jgi:hypothetical protein